MFFFLLALLFIFVLFITFLERKILGLSNSRFSVFSYGLFGFASSLTDFIKLMFKESVKMTFLNSTLWSLILLMSFFISLSSFFTLSLGTSAFMDFDIFVFFFIYSISIYLFVVMNWGSSSFFPKVALYRTLVQLISYETVLLFAFILLFFLMEKYNFFLLFQNSTFSLFFLILVVFAFMCELGRQPFDFLECESELVSGFNVEYYAHLFSLIFLFEYSFLLITLILFVNLNFLNSLAFIFIFIHVRTFFPRFRYDKMLNFFWKDFILFLLFFFICLSLLISDVFLFWK